MNLLLSSHTFFLETHRFERGEIKMKINIANGFRNVKPVNIRCIYRNVLTYVCRIRG